MLDHQLSKPTEDASRPDVFVSYAGEDLSLVENLVRTLDDAGLEVWVDVTDLYAGEQFCPEITAAIDSAAVLLLVITPLADRQWD